MRLKHITVSLKELYHIVDESLRQIGLPEEHVEITRDVLMYAQLRGNNQGLVKIPVRGVLPRADATATQITRRLPCVVHFNANGNSGMATMHAAAIESVALANVHGVAVASVGNLSSSTGAIGYYANLIAQAGKIGIVMAGSPKAVAPVGSTSPILGTNPIAISTPTPAGPVVLDMTTAKMAWYGLIQAQQAAETIAADTAYDANGAMTTDPAAALGGAIMAFAGNKGSGLALMIEVLTGPLIGSALAGEDDAGSNFGDLIITLDPAAFGDHDMFMKRVGLLMEKVKSAQIAPGCEEIMLPGERGNRQSQAVQMNDRIEIEKSLYDQLVTLAQG